MSIREIRGEFQRFIRQLRKSYFYMEQRSFVEFGIPLPEEPERFHLETVGFMWSPDRKVCETVAYPFYVLDKPAFHQRMVSHVRDSGGEVL